MHNRVNASMDVEKPESGATRDRITRRERNKLARMSRTYHDDSDYEEE